MTLVPVSIAESAIRDIEEMRNWYESRDASEVGNRFADEIFKRIETLEKQPNLGRMVPEFGQTFLRELIYPPYRIVYRCDTNKVRIIRIWRSERLLKLP